jgi:hypothetical protein
MRPHSGHFYRDLIFPHLGVDARLLASYLARSPFNYPSHCAPMALSRERQI